MMAVQATTIWMAAEKSMSSSAAAGTTTGGTGNDYIFGGNEHDLRRQ